MRALPSRRLASFLVTLTILAIPAVVAILTAAPVGCSGGCMNW